MRCPSLWSLACVLSPAILLLGCGRSGPDRQTRLASLVELRSAAPKELLLDLPAVDPAACDRYRRFVALGKTWGGADDKDVAYWPGRARRPTPRADWWKHAGSDKAESSPPITNPRSHRPRAIT